MEGETKGNGRYSVKQMYCTQDVADAVNNHRWFDMCITGNDRAHRVLEALDFAEAHKAAFDRGEYGQDSEREKSLEGEVSHWMQEAQAQEAKASEWKAKASEWKAKAAEWKAKASEWEAKASEAEGLKGRISELEQRLQTARDAAGSTEEGNVRLAEEIRGLKETIAGKEREIEALHSEQINWAKIATAFDPAYSAVVEEITRRLNAKYHHDAAPQDVLMSFFIRYYYKQEAEFAGMPFVIRPREIMELIRSIYPEMTDKILSKALGIMHNA